MGFSPCPPKTPPGGSSSSGQTQVPGDTIIPDPMLNVYGEVSGVTQNILTDILVFSIPATPIHHLLRVTFGGTIVGAEYFLEINGATQDRFATSQHYGTDGSWNFSAENGGGLLLPPNGTLKIRVIHCRDALHRGNPVRRDFHARFSIKEIS